MEKLIESAQRSSIAIKSEAEDLFYVPPSQVSPARSRPATTRSSLQQSGTQSITTPSRLSQPSAEIFNREFHIGSISNSRAPAISSPQRTPRELDLELRNTRQPELTDLRSSQRARNVLEKSTNSSQLSMASPKSTNQTSTVPISQQTEACIPASQHDLTVTIKMERDLLSDDEETDQVVLDLAKKEAIESECRIAPQQQHLGSNTSQVSHGPNSNPQPLFNPARSIPNLPPASLNVTHLNTSTISSTRPEENLLFVRAPAQNSTRILPEPSSHSNILQRVGSESNHQYQSSIATHSSSSRSINETNHGVNSIEQSLGEPRTSERTYSHQR